MATWRMLGMYLFRQTSTLRLTLRNNLQPAKKIPLPPNVCEICTLAEMRSIANTWQSIQSNLLQVRQCCTSRDNTQGVIILNRCKYSWLLHCTQAFVLSKLHQFLIPLQPASTIQLTPANADAAEALASKLRIVRCILLASKSKRCAAIARHEDNPNFWWPQNILWNEGSNMIPKILAKYSLMKKWRGRF